MIVYIYALVDPNTDEVRYIGKTNNLKRRLGDHCNKGMPGNNPHKSHWIAKLRAEGKKPKIIVLQECDSDTWEEAESHWISHYRSIGARLTNVLSGGRSARDFQPRARSTKLRISKPKPASTIASLHVTKDMYERLMAHIGPIEDKRARNAAIRKVTVQALEKFMKRHKRAKKREQRLTAQ